MRRRVLLLDPDQTSNLLRDHRLSLNQVRGADETLLANYSLLNRIDGKLAILGENANHRASGVWVFRSRDRPGLRLGGVSKPTRGVALLDLYKSYRISALT